MGWFQGNSSGNYFLLVEAANLEKKGGIINRDGALIFLNDQLNKKGPTHTNAHNKVNE